MPTPASLKLISIAVLALVVAGGSFTVAWQWRSNRAEVEVAKAETKVRESLQKEIGEERARRAEFQQQMFQQVQSLSQDLRRLRGVGAAAQEAVTKDRARNPDFYDQPIPDTGRKAWMDARSAATAALAASSPASQPQPQ